ncbi:MAG: hypothetical protein DRH24_11065 [Deltaproteobacteria bacterium]|nr:MAG: hypothetical protein DRH24_11065 [Deltaproteobacteria bacterium]
MIGRILKSVTLFIGILGLCFFTSTAYASDDLKDQLQELQRKLDQLERKVKQQDQKLQDQQLKVEEQQKVSEQMKEIKDALTGISINAGITMVGQGTFGDDNGPDYSAFGGPNFDYENGTDASFSIDLEISKEFDHNGMAYILLEGGNGDGIDDRLNTWSGFNDDADDDDNVHVTEAWYEQSLLDSFLVFTFGKLDLTNYFDTNEVANDETTQFLSTGFVNNLAIEFPENGFAARATVSPTDLVDISVGWANVDKDSGDESWDDVGRGSFVIGEIGLKPEIGGLQGNYRFFGWYSDYDHIEWHKNPFLDDSSTDEGYGYGISFDQQVVKDIITLFVRAGWQNDDVYEFDAHYSGGLQVAGSLWNREDDAFGLAYGLATISDDYKHWHKKYGDKRFDDDENHIELYYSLAFNEHVAVTADYQWVNNPMGYSDADDMSVFGLRTQICF